MWWKPLYMGVIISLITIILPLEFSPAVARPHEMLASMIPANPKGDEYNKLLYQAHGLPLSVSSSPVLGIVGRK